MKLTKNTKLPLLVRVSGPPKTIEYSKGIEQIEAQKTNISYSDETVTFNYLVENHSMLKD
jgi:hypothetical protein